MDYDAKNLIGKSADDIYDECIAEVVERCSEPQTLYIDELEWMIKDLAEVIEKLIKEGK